MMVNTSCKLPGRVSSIIYSLHVLGHFLLCESKTPVSTAQQLRYQASSGGHYVHARPSVLRASLEGRRQILPYLSPSLI